MEKTVGIKKTITNKDGFYHDIDKLAKNEQFKDNKAFQDFFTNIKSLLKKESQEDFPMMSSQKIYSFASFKEFNEIPEECPESSENL